MIAALRISLSLVGTRDRNLILLVVLIQMCLALLDLAGVLLIGAVGVVAAELAQGAPPNPRLSTLFDWLGLQDLSAINQVMWVALFAVVILLAKSMSSAVITRITLRFLAGRQAAIAANLIHGSLGSSWKAMRAQPTQVTLYSITNGLNSATLVLIGQFIVLATECATVLLLAGAMLLTDLGAGSSTVIFFALVAWVLYRSLSQWASRLGAARASVDQATIRAVDEAISSFRELEAAGRRGQVVDEVVDLRTRSAFVEADLQFLGLLPKYVLEVTLVIAAGFLSLFLLSTKPLATAFGLLALFLAAATRVVPSLFRIQVAFLGIRTATSAAQPTFDLIAAVRESQSLEGVSDVQVALQDEARPPFQPSVRLSRVSIWHPGMDKAALEHVDLEIQAGEAVGIVGPSGSGKSTLLDVILGILEPQSGSAEIGGERPRVATRLWTGKIAYVPQTVHISQDTVLTNVAMGIRPNLVDQDRVIEVLEIVGLGPWLMSLQAGIHEHLGERGYSLSGGQRQRIGLARALYGRPHLLALDEATSALDVDSESVIDEALASLRGSLTLLVVAHRLSTVRDLDSIVYLSGGRIDGRGSFDELLETVPAFRSQAQRLGMV